MAFEGCLRDVDFPSHDVVWDSLSNMGLICGPEVFHLVLSTVGRQPSQKVPPIQSEQPRLFSHFIFTVERRGPADTSSGSCEVHCFLQYLLAGSVDFIYKQGHPNKQAGKATTAFVGVSLLELIKSADIC